VRLRKIVLTNGGNLTLRVATAGPEDGVPVLMMHGFPESWFSWRHQLVALARAGYFAVAPDMRGYGHSDAPPQAADYSVHHIASDMVALLQELGLRKAVLVGHDWGAVLTWLLARLLPQYFPVIAALSVPTHLRTHGAASPIDLFGRIFGSADDPDRLFFYQSYHQVLQHVASTSHVSPGACSALAPAPLAPSPFPSPPHPAPPFLSRHDRIPCHLQYRTP